MLLYFNFYNTKFPTLFWLQLLMQCSVCKARSWSWRASYMDYGSYLLQRPFLHTHAIKNSRNCLQSMRGKIVTGVYIDSLHYRLCYFPSSSPQFSSSSPSEKHHTNRPQNSCLFPTGNIDQLPRSLTYPTFL